MKINKILLRISKFFGLYKNRYHIDDVMIGIDISQKEIDSVMSNNPE